jgi:hypothetical protein
MKVSALITGAKYRASCFNNDLCTFVAVQEYFSDDCALLTVQYHGRLYLATVRQLKEA